MCARIAEHILVGLGLQSQMELQQTSSSSNAVDQRVNEITGIAQSIAELADLFKDLSVLVIDQGTLLDRVDYNIEKMAVDVEAAAEELTIATQFVLPFASVSFRD